jgi:hypothetical protein
LNRHLAPNKSRADSRLEQRKMKAANEGETRPEEEKKLLLIKRKKMN